MPAVTFFKCPDTKTFPFFKDRVGRMDIDRHRNVHAEQRWVRINVFTCATKLLQLAPLFGKFFGLCGLFHHNPVGGVSGRLGNPVKDKLPSFSVGKQLIAIGNAAGKKKGVFSSL